MINKVQQHNLKIQFLKHGVVNNQFQNKTINKNTSLSKSEQYNTAKKFKNEKLFKIYKIFKLTNQYY